MVNEQMLTDKTEECFLSRTIHTSKYLLIVGVTRAHDILAHWQQQKRKCYRR